jgi:hypothetical protein
LENSIFTQEFAASQATEIVYGCAVYAGKVDVGSEGRHVSLGVVDYG